MLEKLLAPLAHFAITLISSLGYTGVALAMAIESACIPLPSEIVMPFSGYLVAQGRFTLLGIALAGTVGCVVGSLVAYALGYFGGEKVVRQIIRKYGKYLFIHESEFDQAIHWFDKYGNMITFTSRLLPVIRTFISLPAGIAKMNIYQFLGYAAAGSFIWSYLLGYIGFKLGQNWDTLGGYFHKFDIVIIVGAALAVGWYIWHKLRKH
jgi:membrane protein DedA with SNARE-associated domain